MMAAKPTHSASSETPKQKTSALPTTMPGWRRCAASVNGWRVMGKSLKAGITQSGHFSWPSGHTRAVSAREYYQPLPGVSLSPCDFHRSVQAPEECAVARPPQAEGLPHPSRASSCRRLEAPGEDQTPRFWACPRPARRRAPWRSQARARCPLVEVLVAASRERGIDVKLGDREPSGACNNRF